MPVFLCFLCANYFCHLCTIQKLFLCAIYIMPLCFLVPCRVFCASTLIISLLCPDSRFFFSSTDTNWCGPSCHTGLGLGPLSSYTLSPSQNTQESYHRVLLHLVPAERDQSNPNSIGSHQQTNSTKCALTANLLFVSNVVCCLYRAQSNSAQREAENL